MASSTDTETDGTGDGGSGGGEPVAPVHRIEFETDWPPGHVGCYLIAGDEPVLVDAGVPDDETSLPEGLAEHGYDLADIEHLVCTHDHPDHVGQVPAVLEAADPTVYAPVAVRERFDRDEADLRSAVERNARLAGCDERQREAAVEWATQSREFSRSLLPPDPVDRWVTDGETVTVAGWALSAIRTPGHSAEHLCFRTSIENERVLFSGDMGIRTFRAVAMHAGLADGVADAIGKFHEALDILADLGLDRVYPGHGPPHTEYRAALEQSRKSLENLLDRTEERLEDAAPATAMDLVRDRLDGGRDIGYMLPETVAGLAELERGDRATVETIDGARVYDLA